MRGNMLRAAFSSAVCELHDMSCAILDGEGQLLALSEGDNPQHVFPIIWSAEQLLQKFKATSIPAISSCITTRSPAGRISTTSASSLPCSSTT
jgi:N-methylhydantoinase B/oxoprolinase/acetone carboxylase alpha subunit